MNFTTLLNNMQAAINVATKGGGMTLDQYGNRIEFYHGYIVSLKGATLSSPTVLDVAIQLDEAANDNFLGCLVGTYQMPDGRIAIDRNMYTCELEYAKRVAKRHNQHSIWDCANNKEIVL